jgi:hypothetical protein
MPGFYECVQQAWHKPIATNHSAAMTLHIKFSRTAKALAAWARSLIPQGKLAVVICREVIHQLGSAQEARPLSDEENQLKKLLKSIILGLAAIERSRARQKSRLTWLKAGDANTKYFHIMASNRKKRNLILSLTNGSAVATNQADKHQMVFDHYQSHIGSCTPRMHHLNFGELGWQPQQLQHLSLKMK